MSLITQYAIKVRNSTLQSKLHLGFFVVLTALAAIMAGEAYAESSKDHPLVGKLWSVNGERFIDVDELEKKLLKSDYVAVGETHDNMDHHRIQAKILNWFVSEKKVINPVFEMLSDRQLDSIQRTKITSSDSFFDKVSWEESGWPNRKLYKPIFDIVIEQNLPIFAAETERNLLMQLTKGGEEQLPSDIAEYLSKVELDENAKEQMRQEIIASHCGMLPETMVDPMILGQRVRDAVMAKSLVSAAKSGTAILFSGSGHGRNDYGVPAYVKQHDPQAIISTIAMMEVVNDVNLPSEYSEAWASDTIPFDYVWFTDRVERGDPCEELRQHFKKHPV